MIEVESRTDQPVAPPPPTQPTVGRLVTGVLIVLGGVAWLLDLADILEIRWSVMLPIALIVIGLGVMYGAHRQDVGGLIAIGVIVAALVVVTGTFRAAAPWEGVGQVIVEPGGIAQLEATYEHGIGELIVDLRAVDFPEGTTDVEVSLGIGATRVLLPADVVAEVDASAGIGDVRVFGTHEGGLGPDLTRSAGEGASRVEIAVSVGIGEVEVSR